MITVITQPEDSKVKKRGLLFRVFWDTRSIYFLGIRVYKAKRFLEEYRE